MVNKKEEEQLSWVKAVNQRTRDYNIGIRNSSSSSLQHQSLRVDRKTRRYYQDTNEQNVTEKKHHKEKSNRYDISSDEEAGEQGSSSEMLGADNQTFLLIGQSSRLKRAIKPNNKFII